MGRPGVRRPHERGAGAAPARKIRASGLSVLAASPAAADLKDRLAPCRVPFTFGVAAARLNESDEGSQPKNPAALQ
jgi:hypothetical protein